jgi:mono/diheme cytochrome c family protein
MRPAGTLLPDFADPAFRASKTDEALVEVIANGRGMMPAFGDRLSPEAMEALIAHLRR